MPTAPIVINMRLTVISIVVVVAVIVLSIIVSQCNNNETRTEPSISPSNSSSQADDYSRQSTVAEGGDSGGQLGKAGSAASNSYSEERIYTGEKYPQTRTRLITEEEAAAMSFAELRYAINEIYARHGADFPNQRAIARRFRQFEWYHPRMGVQPSEIENEFTDTERDNVKLLAGYRDQRRASGER